MADLPQDNSFQLKHGGTEVVAHLTDKTADGFLNTASRMWDDGLTWAHNNQGEFVATLIVFGLLVAYWMYLSAGKKRMVLQYKLERLKYQNGTPKPDAVEAVGHADAPEVLRVPVNHEALPAPSGSRGRLPS